MNHLSFARLWLGLFCVLWLGACTVSDPEPTAVLPPTATSSNLVLQLTSTPFTPPAEPTAVFTPTVTSQNLVLLYTPTPLATPTAPAVPAPAVLLPRLVTWQIGYEYAFRLPKDAILANGPDEAMTIAAQTPSAYPPCPTCYHTVPEHTFYQEDMPATGPAGAVALQFARYQNEVAYWLEPETGQGQLWVADMELKTPQLVFTDEQDIYNQTEGYYPYFYLIWTPDDLHLILDPRQPELPNLIYHRQTGQVEEWPYFCDRFALSPHTQKVAWWCVSEQDSKEFAVVEWGGEIWFSPTIPEQTIVQYAIDAAEWWRQENWAWSSDGQQLAYFDPADEEGHLWLTTAEGVSTPLFPGSAWWLNFQSTYNSPDNIIHWSFDNQNLLVYAHDLYPASCPPYRDYVSLSDEFIDHPCWQLIDTKNYKLIWSWKDAVTTSDAPDEDKLTHKVYDATLSADGQYISINYREGIPHFSRVVIRLPRQDAQWLFEDGASAMRWYNP